MVTDFTKPPHPSNSDKTNSKRNVIIIIITVLIILCVIGFFFLFFRSDAMPKISTGIGKWTCIPGINTPIRKYRGEIQCMSENGRDCLWKKNHTDCSALLNSVPSLLNPLNCGVDHKKKWGSTGYDNPNHWCYKGKQFL